MASYGKYKESIIEGEKGTSWYIEVHKKDYVDFITNNSFINGLSGWSITNASLNPLGGVKVGSQAGSFSYLQQQSLSCVDGTTYYVTIKVSGTSGNSFKVRLNSVSASDYVTLTGDGTHKLQITAGNNSTDGLYIINNVNSVLSSFTVESVSVSETEYNTQDLLLSGEGFHITWNGEGSTRDRTFIGSECSLNMFVRNDDEESFLYNILDNGFKKYFIRIFKGIPSVSSNIWWYGYIQPSFDVVENLPYPYVSQINSTDSYGYYKTQPITTFQGSASYTVETAKNSNHSISKIFLDFIKNMDLFSTSTSDGPCPDNVPLITTGINWTTQAQKNSTFDPANRYYFCKGAYADNKDFPLEYNEFDVIKDISRVMNSTGFLAEGSYYFLQPNIYLNNTTATSKLYEYYDVASSEYFVDPSPTPTTGSNVSSLLTIDQSSHAIVNGSAFVYEPPLKSASVTFDSQAKPFEMSPQTELSNNVEYMSGQLLANTTYDLNFNLTRSEDIDLDNVSTSNNAGWLGQSSGMKVAHSTFSCTMDLEIKVTDGTNTKYLAVDSTIGFTDYGTFYRYPRLIWTDLQRPITLHRGYGYPDSSYTYYSEAWNNSNCVGSYASNDNTNGPCYIEEDWIGGQGYTPGVKNFRVDFNFSSDIPEIDFNGTVFVKIDVDPIKLNQRGTHTFPMQTYAQTTIFPLTANTRTNVTTSVNEVTTIPYVYSSTQVVTSKYTSTQTTNSAVENKDLGGVTVGQTSSNPAFSVRDYYNIPIASFFQRGLDDSSSAALNQLLVDEYLDMQVTPLKILQGDIQSNDISPLKIIKYSINNDGNYEYFMFLGGTFKAQSEIMSGEWFRLKKG